MRTRARRAPAAVALRHGSHFRHVSTFTRAGVAPESARAAGLRHVDPDTMRGLKRVRRGTGFVYLDERGQRLREHATLTRIRKMAIPPAWDDVWICPIPNGHIQARGRDARRRKHPAVLDSYLRGRLASTRARGDEAFVKALLAREGRLSKTRSTRGLRA